MNYPSQITRVTLKKEQIEVKVEVRVPKEEAIYLVLSEINPDASAREFAREIIPERGSVKKRIRCPKNFKIGAHTRIKAHLENAANERKSKSTYIEKDHVKILRNSLILCILFIVAIMAWLSMPEPLTVKIESAYFKDHRSIFVQGQITSKQIKKVQDLKLQLLHEGKVKHTKKITNRYFTFHFPYSMKEIEDHFEVQLVYHGRVMGGLTTKITFADYPIVQLEKAWLEKAEKIYIRIHTHNVKNTKVYIVEQKSRKNVGVLDVTANGKSILSFELKKSSSSKRYGVYIKTPTGNTPLKWVEYDSPQGNVKKAFFTTAYNGFVAGIWFGPKNSKVFLQIVAQNKVLAQYPVNYGNFSQVFALPKSINNNQQYFARLKSEKNTFGSLPIKMRGEFKKLVVLKQKGIEEITRQLDLILYRFYKKQIPMEEPLRKWYSAYQESYRQALTTRRLKGHERESELLREYLRQLKLLQKDMEDFLEDVTPLAQKWFAIAKAKSSKRLRKKKEKLRQAIALQISRSRFVVTLNLSRIRKMAKMAKRLNAKGKILQYSEKILTWSQNFLK